MSSQGLPPDFDDLSPFIGEWGDIDTQDERYLRRQSLPMERLAAYYEAMKPRLPAVFQHLEAFPFGQPLPAPQALLFRVVMAMAEVAQAIEVFDQPRVPHAPLGHSVPVKVMARA